MSDLNGALTCARYAFAPNLYQYCGPDTKGAMEDYLEAEIGDGGLVGYLSQFETLYPYLKAIATANGLADPFDERVVEAYWVGNQLLERLSEKDTYRALTFDQNLTKRIPKKELKWLLPKIDRRARLHHSFHVFNVFTRTGHRMIAHSLETMDECRISWGEILKSKVKSQNAKLQVKSQKLIYKDGTLILVPAVREVVVVLESLKKQLKPGDWVSVHWGIACEVLTKAQVSKLHQYTDYHLQLANETL